VIRFENLKKSFRGTEVLKGLDLEIKLGDRIALVGSNGAGKTTMIRCLLGEYNYDGTVLVGGLVPRENDGGPAGGFFIAYLRQRTPAYGRPD